MTTAQSAYGAFTYEQNVVPKLIKWYHATAGFPATRAWMRAIRDGFYLTWPGLTAAQVKKHLGISDHTTYGHLQLIRQGIRSTTKSPVPPTDQGYDTINTSSRSKTHKVAFNAIVTKELKNMIGSGLAGRFPTTSARGHKYILIMYDYDANYTYAIPIKSREAPEIKRGSKEAYNHLTKNGFHAKIV